MATERARIASDPDLPPTPLTFDEAMRGPFAKQWEAALEKEKVAIDEHGTYKPAPDWKGRTVKSKLAFRVTREPDGSLKFKVRLVAKGFSERLGFDYFATFAPTVATKALHMMLHIGATEDLEMRHIDVSGAYLEADVDTELYMTLPLDMTAGVPTVVKLIKSIYGLKQSGELWNKKLDGILKGLGFSRSICDPCIYFRNDGDKGMFYIAVYVDDILTMAKENGQLQQFEEQLKTKVMQIRGGPLERYVGTEITRDRANRTITLTQGLFARDLVKKHGVPGDSPKPSPAIVSRNLYTATKGTEEPIRPLAGSVRFIVDHTRSEILFAASQVSSAAGNPGQEHVQAARHLVRYIDGTADVGLTLGGDYPIDLEAWVDASLVDEGDSLSQLAWCLRLNKHCGMYHSRSKRDTRVSFSSAEAELRALKEAATEVAWARDFLEELGYPQRSPTKIFEDNSAVIDMLKSVQAVSRTKHLNKTKNFIRDFMKQLAIEVVKVDGTKNIADGLTKSLSVPAFLRFRDQILGISFRIRSLSRRY